jgi:hypothetical protein
MRSTCFQAVVSQQVGFVDRRCWGRSSRITCFRYVSNKKWQEAFALADRSPDLAEAIYMPYAELLASGTLFSKNPKNNLFLFSIFFFRVNLSRTSVSTMPTFCDF